ncbi:expressed unknown protein [Seminavis robusta]|uniref:Endonuclease/exonuclease/phosphatase domain-containing protein n=1 Tax=Seminavis robusta TaxID=568900 RepID=A0A9N8E1U6_9STRA|nr:expressed unknown protein [Seminavis robusta]|eukprot:Sro460_g147580.1 n/a (440) ;mRNA; r:49606-50925
MWKFRPQAFRDGYYGKSTKLLELYQNDNLRASSHTGGEDPVSVPPRAHQTSLRTCQWNVHFFCNYMNEEPHSPEEMATAIVNTLLTLDVDIIVLNEFGMARASTKEEGRERAKELLEAAGYELHVADCYCPTVIATRLPVLQHYKLQLDIMRDAVAVQVTLKSNNNNNDCLDTSMAGISSHHDDGSIATSSSAATMTDHSTRSMASTSEDDSTTTTDPASTEERDLQGCSSSGRGTRSRRSSQRQKRRSCHQNHHDEDHVFWIYGTHLQDSEDDGGQYRLGEIKTLVEDIGFDTPNVMVTGCFNQQRRVDYTRDEWQMIVDNKQRRQSPVNDGVAYLLRAFGYRCIWDRPFPAKTNWMTPLDPPPSTHWSGTIVDYTFYKDQRLLLSGVYVSPSNLSDHRLIVSDWELLRKDCGLNANEDRSGPLLAVWNIARRIVLGD